ncbi:MAG: hypothetical protein AAF799_10750 [Myxococcota bacterium]
MLVFPLLAVLAAEPASPAPVPVAPDQGTTETPSAPGDPSTVPTPPVLPEPPPTEPEPAPAPPLRWSAPVSCPSPDAVQRGIEQRLGRRLLEREVEARAEITEDAQGYHLTLRTTTSGFSEERTLSANDCVALADATALMIALAIDPVAVASAIEPWEPSEPEADPPTSAPAVNERAHPTEPAGTTPPANEPSRRLQGGMLRLAANLGLGALPAVSGGPALAAGLRWQRARIELEGHYFVPRGSTPVDGASVNVQLGTATVRGCGQLAHERIEAPLCGGVQLGGMRGDGDSTPGARTGVGLWFALEASIGLSWWFRPQWALSGGVATAVPIVRPGFQLDDEPAVELFEPSSVAGRVWLGIEVRMPSP